MGRKTQRVEGQIELDDGLVGPLHLVAQHPIDVGNVLDHWAQSDEFWVPGKSLKVVPVAGVLEIHPAHDRGDGL